MLQSGQTAGGGIGLFKMKYKDVDPGAVPWVLFWEM